MEWYKAACPTHEWTIKSHFSRLGALKLIFLLSAVKDDRDDNRDLLDIYDKYCAMQYGPVEVDVYSAIALKKTKNYIFGNRALEPKNDNPEFTELDDNDRRRIDNAISILKGKNSRLILCDPFKLVEITHKWDVWQYAMSTAELFGRGSEPMTTEDIRNSKQFYE